MIRSHALLASLSLLAISTSAQNLPTYKTRLVAGSANNGIPGIATEARVLGPSRITGDAAGNIYFYTNDFRIHKVDTAGAITYFAGNGSPTASGDGGPALVAGIPNAFGMAVLGDYLYFSQQNPCNIRRIHLITRIISNFAGTGACQAGTAGPAAQSPLMYPTGLTFDPQGRLYVGESTGIRRVDASNQIAPFAGGSGTSDTGNALVVPFRDVRGLAADDRGNIYAVAAGDRRVRRIDGANGAVTLVRTLANSEPCGLAISPTGNKLYLACRTAVGEIDVAALTYRVFAGSGSVFSGSDWLENGPVAGVALTAANDVWVDSGGRVFIVDFKRVMKVSSTGFGSTIAGGNVFRGEGRPAQQNWLFPSSVLAEPDGSVLVGDFSTQRIIRVSKQGVAFTVAGRSSCPESQPGPVSAPACPGLLQTGDGGPALGADLRPGQLARDNAGNTYFVELLPYMELLAQPIIPGRSGVRGVTPNGVMNEVGPRAYAANPNAGTSGVAVDPTGRFLYWSHAETDRVLRWDRENPEISPITVAGKGTFMFGGQPGFSGDGFAATNAQLQDPANIALDTAGNLYIADYGNNRIRKVDTNGIITTVAGNGKTDYSGDGEAATAASVPGPVGIAVDAQGNLFISTAAAILRVDKTSGRLHRIAGGTSIGFTPLGGNALDARFNATSPGLISTTRNLAFLTPILPIGGIAVAPNGEILFPDLFNRRVVALVPDSFATPTISGVINLSNFGAGEMLSSGGWLEIYGFKLSPSTVQWAGSDFNGNAGPTLLGGTQVLFNGTPGVVQLISPGQINAIPKDGIVAGNTGIQIVNATGQSNIVSMTAALRGPGMLAPPTFTDSNGKQFVAALHVSDGAFVGPPNLIPGAVFRRAKSGDRLILYGVGFGSVSPHVPAGNIATGATALPNFRIKIGGKDVVVEYASLAPGFVGLYQFNIVVPSGASVDAALEVTVDGVAVAQALFIGVE